MSVIKNYKELAIKVSIANDLVDVLEQTRSEPGLSLELIAFCINSTLKVEEVESLIKELRYETNTEQRGKSPDGTAKNKRKRINIKGNRKS